MSRRHSSTLELHALTRGPSQMTSLSWHIDLALRKLNCLLCKYVLQRLSAQIGRGKRFPYNWGMIFGSLSIISVTIES